MKRARVALVEDHQLFAEVLDLSLTMQGYDVVRVPLGDNLRSADSLYTPLVRANPGIALLDLDLGPVGSATRLIEPLARAGIHVVVVTGETDRVRWGECLRYGARRVIPKAAPLQEVLGTVRRLNDGLPVMRREEREELITQWQQHRATMHALRERIEQLTNREKEILGHLMLGHHVRDIAQLNVVSQATVRTQVKSILDKLEVCSQLSAVGVAYRAQWRPAEPVAASAR